MTLDSFMIPTVLKCTTSVYTYVKTVTLSPFFVDSTISRQGCSVAFSVLK